MVLAYQKNIHNIDYFTAWVSSANVSKTIKQMEAVLHNIDQDHLFEYHPVGRKKQPLQQWSGVLEAEIFRPPIGQQ